MVSGEIGSGHVKIGLVTNKHVIAGAERISVILTLDEDGKPAYGKQLRVDISGPEAWAAHPTEQVDLACLNFSSVIETLIDRGTPPFYRCIYHDVVIGKEEAEWITTSESIAVVGYPNGIWDHANNLPIVRRGHTATRYTRDFQSRSDFLIDCAIFPGSSGSPVFLFHDGVVIDRQNNMAEFGRKFRLIGVVWGTMIHAAEGEIIAKPAPTDLSTITAIPNLLGIAVRASELERFKELPTLAAPV